MELMYVKNHVHKVGVMKQQQVLWDIVYQVVMTLIQLDIKLVQ